jgi:hypothetical protein
MARVESSVTSLPWIPMDAVRGVGKLAADLGISRWDPPPPERLGHLEGLLAAGAVRFANQLRAWVEVADGRVAGHGQLGGGQVGATTLRAGPRRLEFPAVALPDLRPDPRVGPTWVRFTQTSGGRSGLPLPRRVRRPPLVRVAAPTVWTTLALTIHADGSSRQQVVGRARFRAAGSTTTPARWSPRPAWSTSPAGNAAASGGTPRGARRGRRRW